MPKNRVLVFCDFYLPGYQSGGGMWTVVNLVDRFRDRFDFFLVTRNYDSKADKTPYTTVKTDQWNKQGGESVYYFSNRNFTVRKFAEIVNEIKPDFIFLNSSFSVLTFKLLTARKRKMIDKIPVVLAPCGEMSKGAMLSKPLKKIAFLKYSKLVDLYRDVIWKASSDVETSEIQKVLGTDCEIHVAADLTPKSILPDYSQELKPVKEKGSVRFAVVARLVRKKNIHYFLELLREITTGTVHLDIIGPHEDRRYWQQCLAIINQLPPNITVTAAGASNHVDTLHKLFKSHFFALPTLNENFGYVFVEAMAAGCPVLTSDRTIWKDIEKHNAGWQIPLEEPQKWVEQINKCIGMEANEFTRMSISARRYAEKWLAATDSEDANAAVFQRALARTSAFADKA